MTIAQHISRCGSICIALAVALAAPSIAKALDPLSPTNPYVRPGSPTLAIGGEAYIVGAVPSDYHLIKSTTFPYAFTGAANEAFKGNVTSNVYQQSSTGFLAFAYQFDNEYVAGTGAGTEISSTTIGDMTVPFGDFTVTSGGVDDSLGGHSTAVGTPNWTNGDPDTVAYNTDGNGLAILFNEDTYGTQLRSITNDQSSLIWLTTNAKNYQQTNVGLSDTSLVGTANAYAPAPGELPPAPEPASATLACLAVAGGVLAYRRTKKRS